MTMSVRYSCKHQKPVQHIFTQCLYYKVNNIRYMEHRRYKFFCTYNQPNLPCLQRMYMHTCMLIKHA